MTRMNILYSGHFHTYPDGEIQGEMHARDGFESLGHNVVATPPNPLAVIDAARKHPPDIWLFNRPGSIPRWAVFEVRRISPKCKFALWEWDHLGATPVWLFQFGRLAEAVFTKEVSYFDIYRREGMNPIWMDQAVPEWFPFGNATYYMKDMESDIAFLGSPLADRIEVIQRLRLEFRVQIYTRNPEDWLRQGINCLKSPVFDDKIAHVAASAKVVLGLDATHEVYKCWSNRVYMTLGTGGFYLTRYVPGMEEVFENYRHLVWFRSPGEMMELLRHYLNADEEREKIRRAGYEYVHSRHTYRHRCQEFLDKLVGIPVRPGRRITWFPSKSNKKWRISLQQPTSQWENVVVALRRSQRWFDAIEGCSTVLDADAGEGVFLHSLLERGVQAMGIVRSTRDEEICRQRGLPIVCSDDTLPPESLAEHRFEAISLGYLLHTVSAPEVQERLKAWARYLANGGVLLFILPQRAKVASPDIDRERVKRFYKSHDPAWVATIAADLGFHDIEVIKNRPFLYDIPRSYPLWSIRYLDAVRRRLIDLSLVKQGRIWWRRALHGCWILIARQSACSSDHILITLRGFSPTGESTITARR